VKERFPARVPTSLAVGAVGPLRPRFRRKSSHLVGRGQAVGSCGRCGCRTRVNSQGRGLKQVPRRRAQQCDGSHGWTRAPARIVERSHLIAENRCAALFVSTVSPAGCRLPPSWPRPPSRASLLFAVPNRTSGAQTCSSNLKRAPASHCSTSEHIMQVKRSHGRTDIRDHFANGGSVDVLGRTRKYG
jgi:hypothetical protein